MVYALKTQRLTTRKTPKSHFITCQIHPSSQEKEGYAGCLFSLVEIDNEQYSSTQIGHSIINTTAREYFRLLNENASENFELALKKTNELLANYTQDGQTDWIGNLHAIIALIYKDQIHITSVGKAISLLIRDGKASGICQDAGNSDEIHPLCTFSNITSGQLETNDVILFATKNLFSTIPKKDLKQLIEINSLEDASVEIAQTLSHEKITDVNLILVETTTKENLASEPLSSIPETIYIDETGESILNKLRYLFKKKLWPKITLAAAAAISGYRTFSDWLKKKNQSKSSNKVSDFLSSTSSHLRRALSNLSKKLNKKDLHFLDDVTASLAQPNVKINHYGKLGKLKLKNVPLYPVLLTILVIILALSIFFKVKHSPTPKPTAKQPSQTNSTELSDLKTKFSLTKSANKKEAITLLNDIMDQLSNKKLTPDETTLLKQSRTKYYSLTNTTPVVVPSKKTALPDNMVKFFILDNQIYAFTQNGTIYKNPLNAESLISAVRLPANAGNIISVSPPTSKKTFLIYTSKQKIFEFQTQKSQVKILAALEDWKNAIAIATYSSNIYLLDQQSQIWKYTYQASQDKYSKALAYISSPNPNLALKNIAVDGTIYSQSETGKIYKIQKTGATLINYQKFPDQSQIPAHPTAFTTTQDSDQFFTVEQNKIILTDKTGTYIKTLALENQAKIQDVSIQPILRKIWIASGSSLFSTDY